MITSATAKAAICRWADGYHALEEWALDFQSRVDLLLIPVGPSASVMECNRTSCNEYMSFWERCGLVGVEVKVSRPDFLRGLKEGQFTRYAEALRGLYVAFPRGVARVKELPENVGILTLVEKPSGISCVCLRHPSFNQLQPDAETAWRVVFRMREEWAKERRRLEEQKVRWSQQVEKRHGRKVAQAVVRLMLAGGVE